LDIIPSRIESMNVGPLLTPYMSSPRRQQIDKAEITDAVKRYSYLLGPTELFKYVVRAPDPDSEYAAMMDAQLKPKTVRHRKSEKEEDKELLKDGEMEVRRHSCSRSR